MVNPNANKRWYKHRELLVVIPCYVAVAILVIGVIPWLANQSASETKEYTLSIGDDSTTFKVGDGHLTLVLDNFQSEMTSTIYIYGLALSEEVNKSQVFVSGLYSKDGRELTNVGVKPSSIDLVKVSNTPQKVDVQINDSKEAGTFNGWFMLLTGQDVISVPLEASTDPMFLIAILWVTAGALIAIGTWEIMSYIDRKRTESEIDRKTIDIPSLQERELAAARSNNIDEAISLRDTKVELMISQERAKAKKRRYDNRLANKKEATKFTLVDIFSVLFGIALSYVGLLTNPLVMDIQVISQLDVFSLLGIGLGIGSLSGLLNKA